MDIITESGVPSEEDSQELEETLDSEESFRVSRSSGGDHVAPPVGSDSELAQEGRLATVIAEKEKIQQEKRDLQKQLHELHDKHTSLQQSQDKAQDDLKDTKDRLDALLAGTSRLDASRTSDSRSDALIAELEDKLSEAERENETLRREHAVSRVKAETAQRLQDEYDVMKLENAKLARKAAAADKYKQKLEASQTFEKDKQSLQAKVADLQRQLKESDSSNVSTAELRRANQEYRDILSTIEQDRNELNDMKKRVEFEYHTLTARYEESQAEIARHKAVIDELQGRYQEDEDGNTPTTPKQTKANGIPLSDYDSQFSQDEAKLSEEFTTIDVDDQNYISEAELRAIMNAMQAQARDAGAFGKVSGIAEEKKLAEKIERSRHTTKQLIQVIDFLAQPRVEFLGAKGLDSSRPFKPIVTSIHSNVTSIYASANGSVTSLARSSIASFALSSSPSKRDSIASFHSVKSPAAPSRGGRSLSNFFRGR